MKSRSSPTTSTPGAKNSKGQNVDPNKIFNSDIRRDFLRKQYLQRTTGDSVEKSMHVRSIFDLAPKPQDGIIKRSLKWLVNPFGMPFRAVQIGGTAVLAYYLLFVLDFGHDHNEKTVLKPIRDWHRAKKEQLLSLSEKEMEIVRLRERKEMQIKEIVQENQQQQR